EIGKAGLAGGSVGPPASFAQVRKLGGREFSSPRMLGASVRSARRVRKPAFQVCWHRVTARCRFPAPRHLSHRYPSQNQTGILPCNACASRNEKALAESRGLIRAPTPPSPADRVSRGVRSGGTRRDASLHPPHRATSYPSAC